MSLLLLAGQPAAPLTVGIGPADHGSAPGPSLDALVCRLWERITAGMTDCRCPVCGRGTLRPVVRAHDDTPSQAVCSACATVLS